MQLGDLAVNLIVERQLTTHQSAMQDLVDVLFWYGAGSKFGTTAALTKFMPRKGACLKQGIVDDDRSWSLAPAADGVLSEVYFARGSVELILCRMHKNERIGGQAHTRALVFNVDLDDVEGWTLIIMFFAL